jgi:hypothetical protein
MNQKMQHQTLESSLQEMSRQSSIGKNTRNNRRKVVVASKRQLCRVWHAMKENEDTQIEEGIITYKYSKWRATKRRALSNSRKIKYDW